jgi:hypothetical protein
MMLERLDGTLDKLDEKLRVQVDTLWDIRYRMETLERRVGDLDSKVDRRLAEIDSTLGRRFDKLAEVIAGLGLAWPWPYTGRGTRLGARHPGDLSRYGLH